MADESPPGEPAATLFPVFNQNPTTTSEPINPLQVSNSNAPGWLSNTSFTADISTINDVVSTRYHHYSEPDDDEEEETATETEERRPQSRYELVDSSASDQDIDGNNRSSNKKEKRKRRKTKKGAASSGYEYGPSSRKQNIQSWANNATTSSANKEYYFDSRGDRDNLAFGSLYRMDVARYKLFHGTKSSGFNSNVFHSSNTRSWGFDGDNDVNSLDTKLRSEGRYWSAKYAALEHHKNFKRLRIIAPKDSTPELGTDFVPLSDELTSSNGQDSSLVEESWEDEVLRKTKEFNIMTREHPYNEKFWLEFANFQDKVESRQPQRGARLQTLEKKISILERAVEVNPDNEELLLALMNAYQRRDNNDVLIGRWEKLLMHHSGSYKLWREFLRIVQGDFSKFKVSEVRKMFANAIQALSAACSKQHRQAHQNDMVDQELGLVNIFVSLCHFEWQSGYQELATALFQAEIEYSLFCPSLLLSEQGKQRLFEYFWNSSGARIGENGALGWSTWVEKEEEQRQKVMMESSDIVDEGGWTGWSELKENRENEENMGADDVGMEGNDDDDVEEKEKEKDDTEALMKLLGINGEIEGNGEVEDVSTWVKWSEEELSRDCDQWMPIRTESGNSLENGVTDKEGDEEQLLRTVLFEDVSEYLFSITTDEARLSLLYHFIDFFGGRIPQWCSTNSSSWAEKTLVVDSLPDSMLNDLRKVEEILTKTDENYSLEHVLNSSDNINMRSEMMKFVRNVSLQCLNVFPHDHILKEAALVAEELSNTRMNSSSVAITPCRTLAKSLLKSNRQDVHLCGVYARREAAFGNIEYARKVFDMALLSIEGLPCDPKSNASLLFLWYAELELEISNNNSSRSSESLSRTLHILCCLGCGVKYSQFKSQPSSLQLLRARQGFKEQIRVIQGIWIHGSIDENSVASICCASLFEELTSGWESGIEILNQSLSMVLPERRSQSHQLELLFNFYIQMLWKHHSEAELANIWKILVQELQIYPFSPKLYNTLIQIGHLHTSPSKLRRIIDDYLHKKPSVSVCLFALSYEIRKGSSHHRVHRIFERALSDNMLKSCVLLWRLYLSYEIHVTRDMSAARRIYFRAIHSCPWSKRLWLDGFVKLSSVLSAKELSDLLEVMRDKEMNVRTDVYEILLQDEMDVSK
ncbi:uncharacterized protein LOC111893790 isoform X2 [Lactuca sativa]|uniref:Uncharacterized protein n=1 Tax=Lactuca sativa TaxID=4236 RepID=A0A9R1XSB3_LACSA|nr:uncharacterized protein LOC111893790 isoform X2 [Lactuca sativa]KAJ0223926.1 hypothetical protein LSAT_V11C200056200 [Lactuca sativa]